MRLNIYTDGACHGNPGPAAIGVVITDDHQKVLATVSDYIGHGTNNKAEYSAVVRALELAIRLNPEEVVLYLDSELVVRQLNGSYKVKSRSILPLYNKASELLKKFPRISVMHIGRELNTEADALATAALQKRFRP